MPTIELTDEQAEELIAAVDYAADDMDYDLHDTRHGNFYTPDERDERKQRVAAWRRLACLIVALTSREIA